MKLHTTVNSQPCEADIEGRTLLVHFLRDQVGLTGTHVGCETSSCGACTVLLDGRAVRACTVLAAQAQGRSVTTIEGLAQGAQLGPVQQAFSDHHALQCGFCTPGMVMAVLELLRRYPRPTEEEIVEGLSGNLCRCTGYQNIIRAVRALADRMDP